MEDYEPTVAKKLESLDGSVHSQGVKIKHRAWLDMGSEEWTTTPEEIKAAAYQASQATGWGETALKDMMIENYEHLSESTMDATIDFLKEMTEKYSLQIEEVNEEEE